MYTEYRINDMTLGEIVDQGMDVLIIVSAFEAHRELYPMNMTIMEVNCEFHGWSSSDGGFCVCCCEDAVQEFEQQLNEPQPEPLPRHLDIKVRIYVRKWALWVVGRIAGYNFGIGIGTGERPSAYQMSID